MPQLLPSFEQRLQTLQSIQQRVRQNVEEAQSTFFKRAHDVRRDLERRQQITLGRALDDQRVKLYTLQSKALERVNTLVERASAVAPVGQQALQASQRALAERLEQTQDQLESVERPSIEDYDSLNVKQIKAKIEGIEDYYELSKIKRYEAANKDRVTVLRSVDQKLA